MAKCSKCKRRIAKRYCVALGDYLCNLCCGLLREKEISCPQSCVFLEKHRPYQEKRIIERKHSPFLRKASGKEDILSNERMAWLAFQIETPLKEYGEKKKSFTDRDALLALEYARAKVEKGKSLLYMPEEKKKPKNEVGDAINQNIEKCRYEGKIIIPGTVSTYKKEEKLLCLERVMLSVRFLSKDNLEGRNYIEQLIARFSKMEEFIRQKKIITIS
jgi:hypothetical protein